MFFHLLKKIGLFLAAFAVFPAIIVQAQKVEEVTNKSLVNFDLKFSKCSTFTGNQVISEAKFQQILEKPNCSDLKEGLKIDFSKHTLLSYQVGGDCFMHVRTQIFRNDDDKKFIVRIKNLWGGCRAGGREGGWILIDKIPSDYLVEFQEIPLKGRADEQIFESNNFILPEKTRKNILSKTLKPREVDLKNCVQMFFTTQFIIKDKETFLNTVRKDASRDYCLKNLEEIDFEKYSLLGKNINSGYCRRPPGLKVEASENVEAKKYHINISYIDPNGQLCRAVSQYDLWVLVPKLPENYTVEFNVNSVKEIKNRPFQN